MRGQSYAPGQGDGAMIQSLILFVREREREKEREREGERERDATHEAMINSVDQSLITETGVVGVTHSHILKKKKFLAFF